MGPLRAMPGQPVGWVYFVGVDDGHSPIKVGWALDIDRRIAELQCGIWKELVCFGEVHGGRILETWAHRQLVPYRVRREWFQREAALTLLREMQTADRPQLRVA